MPLLETLRASFEAELRFAIEGMGQRNPLREACEYALLSGGKRLRPLITLMTADALGHGLDVLPVALSVEFFHTASLIADDLPCMDDDVMRRGKPSLHRAFGESVAVLASYTLIAEGYNGISQNGHRMREKELFAERADGVVIQCLEAATRCAGIHGATRGQFLDLYPIDFSLEVFRKIVALKTSSLFEVSLLFGWLFGGGERGATELLQQSAAHLGMAFQIADDLEDDGQDAEQAREMNAVALCGREEAISLFREEIVSFRQSLLQLGLWTASFQELFCSLESRGNFHILSRRSGT